MNSELKTQLNVSQGTQANAGHIDQAEKLDSEESIKIVRLLEILIKIDRRIKSNGNNNQ